MKTSEFEFMIRKIIREEIKLAMGEVISEIRKTGTNKTVIKSTDSPTSLKSITKKVATESRANEGAVLNNKIESKINKIKKLTSNSQLNALLEQTAREMLDDRGSLAVDYGEDSDELMMESVEDESPVQAPRQKGQAISAREMIGTMEFKDSEQGRPNPNAEIPTGVVNALTRDYSALVSKFNKK